LEQFGIFVALGKAMMEQINRDKQRLLDNNIEKFPNNLSAIVDQDAILIFSISHL
jgi:hypothetical protein